QIQPGCGVAHSGAPDGAVTVTLAEPLLPSLVAVITAGPALTPLTSPVPSTAATTALSLVQSTVRPLNTLPFASRRVAVSCTVCPTATLAVAGVTVTDATGATTVTVAAPLLPSLVAVITAGPALTPLTSPFPSTVAATALSLVQSTVRPLNTLPFASRSVAVSCTVCPSATVAVGGLTVTVFTFRTRTRDEPETPLCVLMAVTMKSPDPVSAV